jgi:hypothetical protein
VDLSDAVGRFADLFDPDVLAASRLLNGRTGKHGFYGLPFGHKAVLRVAADGISPEQAVDEAIARIKEIQSE